MNNVKKNKIDDFVLMVFTIIGFVILFSLLSKILNDLSNNRGNSIVTSEGEKILSNEDLTNDVIKEIDEYHKSGKWVN
jgi:hypothetical protein